MLKVRVKRAGDVKCAADLRCTRGLICEHLKQIYSMSKYTMSSLRLFVKSRIIETNFKMCFNKSNNTSRDLLNKMQYILYL